MGSKGGLLKTRDQRHLRRKRIRGQKGKRKHDGKKETKTPRKNLDQSGSVLRWARKMAYLRPGTKDICAENGPEAKRGKRERKTERERDQVVDVERQPAAGEERDDDEQHLDGLALGPVLARALRVRHGAHHRTLPQLQQQQQQQQQQQPGLVPSFPFVFCFASSLRPPLPGKPSVAKRQERL